LDSLSAESVIDAMGGNPHATWVQAAPGDTPAQIRQRALFEIVNKCDAVVLVDSDDILHPSRVASARKALETSDLAGCSLRLVNQQGFYLGLDFGLPAGLKPDEVFPSNNVFGLSNSAYRTSLLERCLPIPENTVLVDWYLATKAWLNGARLAFDNVARMDYRQHGANMAQVRSPFSGHQIARDTERVLHHFLIVEQAVSTESRPARMTELHNAAFEVASFYKKVVIQPAMLEKYVSALNTLDPAPLWWSSVAHPSLYFMWR
jgi:hypothetical protein